MMNRLTRCLICATGCALMVPLPGNAQNLADWPAAQRSSVERREIALSPATLRTVTGAKGIVSATASPIAVHAGAQILRSGGTAADAAVATAFTQITTMLGANVSFAGVAQLLYYDAKSHKVYAMDAGWNGWRNERSPQTIPATDLSTLTGQPSGAPAGARGRKTLVPGFMAGMAALHDRFGRLAFARLLEPSIWYAKHGVPATPLLSAYMKLSRFPGRAVREAPDSNQAALPGDRYFSPTLARFLERVAKNGATEMYRGDWARDFVETVNQAGGAATMSDLADYKVRWTRPQSLRLDSEDIYGPESANSAGCTILTTLNILAHTDNHKAYWHDPTALRTTVQALRLATALDWSPAAAMAVAHRLGTGATCASRTQARFGAAAAAQLEALTNAGGPPAQRHHSASVVVIDQWGSIAALVHSSNTPLWGDTGLSVQGVPIPAPAGLYKEALAHLPPGARIPSDMAPLIVLRDNKPVFATAAIGSSEVQETVRVANGLLNHVASPAALMAAPPLLLNYQQAAAPMHDRDLLVPDAAYSPEFLRKLEATGLSVRPVDAAKTRVLRGTLALAIVRPNDKREGVEVPNILQFTEAQ